eukprot:11382761-Prorocentrum_lima.AAC.1
MACEFWSEIAGTTNWASHRPSRQPPLGPDRTLWPPPLPAPLQRRHSHNRPRALPQALSHLWRTAAMAPRP